MLTFPQSCAAIGRYGSIAVIERLIQTVKNGCTRRILVPHTLGAMRNELALFSTWYNGERPHEWLAGATPDEVYGCVVAACVKPRFEPRERWPARSACAGPQTRLRGRPGARLELNVSFLKGRKHLPVISLQRVA